MTKLTTINHAKKEAFVSSSTIAKQCGKKTINTVELISSHLDEFNQFGVLKARFQTAPSGQKIKHYLLNENQAYLLLTYFRNNDKVRAFKINLIKSFSNSRELIKKLITNQTSTQWQNIRLETKQTRLMETDIIRDFVEYATKQGSNNAKFYYANITKMEYKALFYFEKHQKNFKDFLNMIQLTNLKTANNIVEKTMRDEMKKNTHYKKVYKIVKENLEIFVDLIGKTEITEITKCLKK